jgi:glycosyltransferase involved in cell wall biosynthesis
MILKRIYYFYGKHLESKKLYTKAINFYTKAYSESSAIVNYRIGFCYEKQKDYTNANHFFKKAIILEPNKVHWYLHLAMALGALNKNAEALHYLRLGMEVDKDKKYQKKYTKLSKKLQSDPESEPGEENIFMQSAKNINESTILYTIEGTIAKDFDKDKILLLIENRENILESALPQSISLEHCQYKVDNNGFFTASFRLDLKALKIDSDVVINTFDMTLKAEQDYRIKALDDLNEVWNYENYDFIPYGTKYRNYSLIVVRKASKYIYKSNALNITFFLFKIHYKGGVTKVTIDLVNALAEAGHNITLTAMFLGNTSNMYPISKKVNFNYISISSHYDENVLPTSGYTTKESISPFFLHELDSYFSTSNIDILYTPIYSPSVLLSILSIVPASVIKIVGDHSSSRYERYSVLLNNENALEDKHFDLETKRALFFKNINNIDAIHLINPLVKEILVKETNKKLISIPNIIDFGSSLNNHTPFKERQKKIILVGSLLKVKNFGTVIKVFSRLEKAYPDWTLEIYGTGVEEKKLTKLINTLNVSSKVELKGFTSDIQHIYESAMIHLSASHKESFGLTIVESMHCGSITISTKQTIGAKYLINHEKTGFLSEDNTEEGIYNMLNTVLTKIEEGDPLIIDIQTKAYEASNDFNSLNIVHQWEKAIISLQKESLSLPLNRVI